MINNPFPRPTDENAYLPMDVEQYQALTLDEKIEFSIMMLMKECNPDALYSFNYFKDGSYFEYCVTSSDAYAEAPLVQLPLECFLFVYDNYQFFKIETDHLDNFSTKALTLLEVCEFLYGTTRKGAIDNILENI